MFLAALVAALLCFALALALVPTPALGTLQFGPVEGPLPQRVCRTDGGGETREREPVLCERTRWDDGAAEGGTADELYYVTASRFGAVRIADMERRGAAAPRRRERAWASVSAQPVVGTAACVVAPNNTLWTWVALAPSTYAVVGIDMATLQVHFRGTPIDTYADLGVLIRALGPATWDNATQTVYAASEVDPATPLPPGVTPLLFSHNVATDTSVAVALDLPAIFGIDAFDTTGMRIAALEALPASGTLAYALCGYRRQLLTRGGAPLAVVTPPLVVSQSNTNSNILSLFFSNLLAGVFDFVCGAHVRSGCANARLSLMTLGLLQRTPGVGAAINVPTATTMHYVFDGGLLLSQTTNNVDRELMTTTNAPGACFWTHNGTALFTSTSLGDADGTLITGVRLVNDTVLPFFISTTELLPRSAPLAASNEPAERPQTVHTPTQPLNSLSPFSAHWRVEVNETLRFRPARAAASASAWRDVFGTPYFAWLGLKAPPLMPPLGGATGSDEARAAAARIIDGTLVTDPTFAPYQCRFYSPANTFCSCEVLDRWHIVTAAHCLARGNVVIDTSLTLPYFVFIGSTAENNGDAQGVTVTARRSATHPRSLVEAMGGRDVDVGILRLDAPLTFSARIKPIAYARRQSESVREGDVVRVVGWGKSDDVAPTPGLRTYEPRIVSDGIFPQDPGAVRVLATRDDGGIKAACFGDSGTAATVRDPRTGEQRIVGIFSVIVSNAAGACRNGTALFVDVLEAAAWLDGRERFSYTTPFPRPSAPPSRQSGQLSVRVLNGGGDDHDDGHGRSSGGRRQRAIVVATNEPTARAAPKAPQWQPGAAEGARLRAVTFTFAASDDDEAACDDIGPTDGLAGAGQGGGVGGGGPVPCQQDPEAWDVLLWVLVALGAFAVLVLLGRVAAPGQRQRASRP